MIFLSPWHVSYSFKQVQKVLSPCIDDEEAQQHDRDAYKRSRQDEKEYCSKLSSTDRTTDGKLEIGESFQNSKHVCEEEDICPICHEIFQEGEVIAWSKNEVCCHSKFHGECIISWLMTDHNECPLCRSLFIPSNQRETQISSKQ